MSDWLELELAHELRPVKAPEGLWGRVQAARRAPTSGNRWSSAPWAALTAAIVLVAAGGLWSERRTPRLETLAGRELGRTAKLELYSSDPVEIGAWLRREAGVEVAIPIATRAQLQGARAIRERGEWVGEVAYRVGDESALLVVARVGGAFQAPAKHGGFSWQNRRQVYAIACSMPDPPRAACALCHTNL